MAYGSVSFGSRGTDVQALQEKLNEKGYGLQVDGVFGKATQAAVKDYQKKQGLTVDGIAGEKTWGSLLQADSKGSSTGKEVLAGVSDETADRLAALEKGYEASDEVQAAQAERESLAAVKPADYTSGFGAEVEKLYREMMERPGFIYDVQRDGAFADLARLYTQAGRQAMEDTLGQAAQLTGGYGSSYGQTAAQQAYGRYMQQLMELVPEMESAARERYDRQGQALAEKLAAAQAQEKAEKAAWEEAFEAWEAEWERLDESWQEAYKRDYEQYKTMLNYFLSKAKEEQKASDGQKVNSGQAAESGQKGALSSTAAQSLERAVGNYLKGGKSQEAMALVDSYRQRLTPAQKKRFEKLLGQYELAL